MSRFVRAAPAFLLALVFVCVQQAAWLHALSHQGARSPGGREPARLSGAVSTLAAADANSGGAGRGDGGGESGLYCDKCFQFAHLTGAPFAAVASTSVIATAAQWILGRAVAELAADAPLARSRDPPARL
jgi:hypothetical protein